MIEIIACWCIRRKIIEYGISFSEQKNFHESVNEIYVAPCAEHPLFKDRFGRRCTNPPFDLPCECLEFNKGWSSNCKTRCFIINYNSLKLKMIEKLRNIKIIFFDDYLKNIKSMLFFSFCKGCKKVKCCLDNPNSYDELKGKKVLGEI